jgi:hypothetical protein
MRNNPRVAIAYTFQAPRPLNLQIARVFSDGTWQTFCTSYTEADWTEKECWQEVQNLLTSWSGMKAVPHVEADELWQGTQEERAACAAALAKTDPSVLWEISGRFQESQYEEEERLRAFDERLRAFLRAALDRPWGDS